MTIPELYDLVIERLLKGKLLINGLDYGNLNGIDLIAILLFKHGYGNGDYLIRYNSIELTEEIDYWMHTKVILEQ